METMVKTKTATKTRVATVAAAALLFELGLFAFGVGQIEEFKKKSYRTIHRGPAATIPARVTTTDATTESANPGSPKKTTKGKVLDSEVAKTITAEAGPAEIVTIPKNRPILTKLATGSPQVNDTNNYFPLYKIKIDHQKDPAQYGNVSFKQFVFLVSISEGISLEDFQLLREDAGQYYTLEPHAIRAVRLYEPDFFFNLAVNQGSIAAFGGTEKFLVFVTFSNEHSLPPLGSSYHLLSSVDVSSAEGTKKIEVTPVTMAGVQSSGTKDRGGYLINNRAVSNAVGLLQSNGLVNTSLPASPYIFHILRLEPPVDLTPGELDPSYLHLSPTIWSDHSSPNHSAVPGTGGGSLDWFQATTQLGKEVHQ